ncbi:hypothetical protein [Chitinophaga sp.]|uniref:hypothetical protein n=1 Tax=Chitinophaga sp. TaxID=1869181 RepID=UPI0031DAB76C
MNSLFANMYAALETRIITNIPEIKGVYPELQQLDNYKGQPDLWPCVFIDFTTFEFENLAQHEQTASGILSCKLAFSVTKSGSTDFIDKQTAIDYYEIETKLHQLLQGWSNGNCAPLVRTKIDTADRKDNFRVRTLSYNLSFEESIVIPPGTSTPRPAAEFLFRA